MIKIISCVQAQKPNKQGKPFWWVSVEGQKDNAYCDRDLTASVGKEVDAEYKTQESNGKTFHSINFPQEKKGFGGKGGGMSNKQIALLSAALTSPNTASADDVIKRATSFEAYLA